MCFQYTWLNCVLKESNELGALGNNYLGWELLQLKAWRAISVLTVVLLLITTIGSR
jgi:hypothetical protein